MDFRPSISEPKGETAMSVILGSGDFRYRVVEDWAKLPDGWEDALPEFEAGREAGIQTTIWALLNTSEFVFPP